MLVLHRAVKRLIATAAMTGGVAVVWSNLAAPTVVAQAADVTVRGCVERDAAASTPIYKLVTPAPAVKIYRLSAPKDIDIAAHVGHTVDITGTVSADPPGRSSSRESELVVKKLVMVNSSCGSGVPEHLNPGTMRVTRS